MEIKKILECYCAARSTQSYFTHCLSSEELTEQEKDIVYEFVKRSAEFSNELLKICKKQRE